MRRLLTCILLLAGLTACASGASVGQPNCSKGGEVCIEVRVVEPISFDEPVTVTIMVTPKKDIADLGVSLSFDALDVAVEGPGGWEKEVKDGVIYKGGAGWKIEAKANDPLTFTRKVRFPSREGLFLVVASASMPSFRAVDSINIHLTRTGGKVYLSGTPILITPGPLPTMRPEQRLTATPPEQRPTAMPTPPQSPLSTPMGVQSPLATPTRPANP